MPTTVSSTIAAIVDGPSNAMTCSRWARARADSSASVVAWKCERYRYGPKKWATFPDALPEFSFAQRRGSPVRLIAVAVPPW